MFNLFKNKKQEGISITAPCSGRIIPISEVNDPIFSKKGFCCKVLNKE